VHSYLLYYITNESNKINSSTTQKLILYLNVRIQKTQFERDLFSALTLQTQKVNKRKQNTGKHQTQITGYLYAEKVNNGTRHSILLRNRDSVGATSEAGTDHPSGAPEFIPG